MLTSSIDPELTRKVTELCAGEDAPCPVPHAFYPYGIRVPWGRAPRLLEPQFVAQGLNLAESLPLDTIFNQLHRDRRALRVSMVLDSHLQGNFWYDKPKDLAYRNGGLLSIDGQSLLAFISSADGHPHVSDIGEFHNASVIDRLAFRDDPTRPTYKDDEGERALHESLFSTKHLGVSYRAYALQEWKVLSLLLKSKGVPSEVIQDSILKGYKLAVKLFEGQYRRNGRFRLEHAIDVALLLVELGFTHPDDVNAGLHHDGIEDSRIWNPRRLSFRTTEERNEIAHTWYTKQLGQRAADRVLFLSKDYLEEEDGPAPLRQTEEYKEKELRRDRAFLKKFETHPDLELFLIVAKFVDRYCNLNTMPVNVDKRIARQISETHTLVNCIIKGVAISEMILTPAAKRILLLQMDAFEAIFSQWDASVRNGYDEQRFVQQIGRALRRRKF